MKAFEEWRDKNAVSGRSHKADARVWRAALEWADSKIIIDGNPANAKRKIQEELNDTRHPQKIR